MFEKIISFSIGNKAVVAIGLVALILWGVYSLQQLPIDAVPDITNNQVQVVTVTPALAPQEVERLITMPVELTMASIPGITEMRSMSRFGLSVVTIVFEEDVDVYWARAQVDQRLIEIQRDIPQGAGTPILAPVTTGLGEIYQYTLRTKPGFEGKYSLTELRTIQDWIVRRRLLGTPGIADISSFGGFLKQLEIALDPVKMRSAGVSVDEIIAAVDRNNANGGGAYIERRSDVQYIRTDGVVRSPEDVSNIVVKTSDTQTPLRIRDVATVGEGHAIRYGAMTRGSSSEAVGGIVLMLKGANSSQVISTVRASIEQIQKTLPEGVVIEPFLDRTTLVNKAITTVSQNLIEGALIVIFVLVLLLGNLRAGFIVASVIPLSMLFAVSMMRVFGVSGNLMSLGALDFGLIVDGAVIIVESVLHALHAKDSSRSINQSQQTVLGAAVGVRRSAAFGELIIMIVYIPILSLVGVEGKMFKPMAQTVIFAVGGAFILSTTYVPMMSALLLKQGIKTWTIADTIMGLILRAYVPARRFAIRNMKLALSATLAFFLLSVLVFMRMGGEFLPQLDEGDFAIEMRLMTGQNLSASIASAQQAAGILKTQFPEVVRVIGKIGTSEIPLDPMPIESGDLIVVLKDKQQWTSAGSREELATKMQDALAVIPGVSFSFQQPIQMRFNELMTGARQDVVVKVFGEDMDSLESIAHEIGAIASRVHGAEDVYVEPVNGLPQVTIKVDREACARMGVDVQDINSTVRAAFAGVAVGQIYEAERRFDIVVRLDSAYRHGTDDVSSLLVPSHSGQQIPILQVAAVEMIIGPNQIQREDAQRRITIGFNIRGRDVESIVQELENKIASTVKFPSGYYATYGGQFENLAAAKARLGVAVPVAMALILFLLYFTFTNVSHALLIFSAVPLSAIGGVAALYIRGMPFSISAGVGFIALFGVAVLNGIVLLGAFRTLQKSDQNVLRVVLRGTEQRLRPVVMTALVASLGFLPMALSTGDGAEVQRPLATVVIGGLVTSTLLTLVIVPLLYTLLERRILRRQFSKASSLATFVALLTMSAFASAQTAVSPIPLDSALRMAHARNGRIAIARLETEQASRQVTAVMDVPPLSLTYMAGQYNSIGTDNNLSLTQTVPFPTKLTSASSLARETQKESAMRQGAIERQVSHDVKRAYIDVCSAKERIAILESYSRNAQKSLRVAAAREETGEGTKRERISAETETSDAELRLINAAAELNNAELHLGVLCGLKTSLTSVDSVIPSIGSASPSNELQESPRLKMLEQQVRIAERAYQLSTSQYLPDVTLGYFSQTLVGTPLQDPGSFATANDRFTGFTLGVALPIWFFSTSAKVEQSRLAQQIAEQQLQHGKNVHSVEQQQLRSAIELARKSVDFYARRALAESSMLVQQHQRSYEAGEATWLEYQSAVQRHLSVHLMDIDARHRLASLLFQFELLLGISQ